MHIFQGKGKKKFEKLVRLHNILKSQPYLKILFLNKPNRVKISFLNIIKIYLFKKLIPFCSVQEIEKITKPDLRRV